jgi:pimeloyl-ACP methyl ester carboxylesterase
VRPARQREDHDVLSLCVPPGEGRCDSSPAVSAIAVEAHDPNTRSGSKSCRDTESVMASNASKDTRTIDLALGDLQLTGDLTMPGEATAIVLFAHGSGSSRLSRRNRFVARQLAEGGLSTLLFDLLTPAEEEEDSRSGTLRFDVPMLAERLGRATEFVRGHSSTRHLAIGYLGASTGAAAALIAAAQRPGVVGAVVSRGGRPDLAEAEIDRVTCPTLLIVGGADQPVLDLNGRAYARLRCEKRVEVIPGATHLFEEPGALEEVARAALAWFRHFLVEETAPRALLTPPDQHAP